MGKWTVPGYLVKGSIKDHRWQVSIQYHHNIKDWISRFFRDSIRFSIKKISEISCSKILEEIGKSKKAQKFLLSFLWWCNNCSKCCSHCCSLFWRWSSFKGTVLNWRFLIGRDYGHNFRQERPAIWKLIKPENWPRLSVLAGSDVTNAGPEFLHGAQSRSVLTGTLSKPILISDNLKLILVELHKNWDPVTFENDYALLFLDGIFYYRKNFIFCHIFTDQPVLCTDRAV